MSLMLLNVQFHRWLTVWNHRNVKSCTVASSVAWQARSRWRSFQVTSQNTQLTTTVKEAWPRQSLVWHNHSLVRTTSLTWFLPVSLVLDPRVERIQQLPGIFSRISNQFSNIFISKKMRKFLRSSKKTIKLLNQNFTSLLSPWYSSMVQLVSEQAGQLTFHNLILLTSSKLSGSVCTIVKHAQKDMARTNSHPGTVVGKETLNPYITIQKTKKSINGFSRVSLI